MSDGRALFRYVSPLAGSAVSSGAATASDRVYPDGRLRRRVTTPRRSSGELYLMRGVVTMDEKRLQEIEGRIHGAEGFVRNVTVNEVRDLVAEVRAAKRSLERETIACNAIESDRDEYRSRAERAEEALRERGLVGDGTQCNVKSWTVVTTDDVIHPSVAGTAFVRPSDA